MNAPQPQIQAAGNSIDAREFRDTLGCFATGVAVVTTRNADGGPAGLTINSFNSVSMAPPLILWSLSLKSPSLAAFRAHGRFAINILAAGQIEIARRFATPQPDKFAGVNWIWEHDTPVIEDCAAVLQCRTYRRYEGGDHEIFVGEVIALKGTSREGLVFSRGNFCRTASHVN